MAKADTSQLVTFIFEGDRFSDKEFMSGHPDYKGEQPVRQSKLNAKEQAFLAKAEENIANGKNNMDLIGVQFSLIRTLKLYRESYATFAEYCREKHGLTFIHDTKGNPKKSREGGK